MCRRSGSHERQKEDVAGVDDVKMIVGVQRSSHDLSVCEQVLLDVLQEHIVCVTSIRGQSHYLALFSFNVAVKYRHLYETSD